jgi:phosphatidylinositol alpha-1,6-mannosyltransferase
VRVLILSSEFPPGPGGLGTHAYHLALNLKRLGWEVLVMTPQDYATDEEIAKHNQSVPFEIIRLRSASDPLSKAVSRCLLVSKRIRHWRPDAVIASGNRVVWMASYLAAYHRVLLLAVGHGAEFGIKKRWEQYLTRRSFNAADAVVCVSNYTWKQMLSAGIKPRCGQVVPNGADANQFTVLSSAEIDDFRRGLGFEKARLLLTVGNVTDRKGQSIVIRALPHVLSKVPNTHYLIAGLPTKEAELRRLAGELNVAEHVHFFGRVSSDVLVKLLNCCDLFVMTSRHSEDGDFEGYGIAVLEAALCGKPAVVSFNSGLAEAVVNGETGLCVPEGDHRATAQAILQLIENKSELEKLGEVARQRARQAQTWEHRIRDYDLLLRRLSESSAIAPLAQLPPRVNPFQS